MEIRTTMRYHFIPVRMAIIWNQQTTGAGKDVEKGELFALLVGVQTGEATVERSVELLQKIKNAFWLSNPTSGNISKGTQHTDLKERKHHYVHCSIIYNHQDVEIVQVSITRSVDKTTMGHLHNEILPGCKKEEDNFTLCNSTDGPG